MNNRTNSIWQSQTDDGKFEWCNSGTWSGNLIGKLVENAIKNNSKYLKISLYHGDIITNTRPVDDDKMPEKDSLINEFGYDLRNTGNYAKLLDNLGAPFNQNMVDQGSWHSSFQPHVVRLLYEYANDPNRNLLMMSGMPLGNNSDDGKNLQSFNT